jgi:uncharacterized protein
MELVSTNIGVVKQSYQLFVEGNIPAVLERLHEDAVYQYQAPPVVPMAGNFEGKQGIHQFFQIVSETLELPIFEAQEFIDGGDKVVIIGRERARSKKTGKEAEWTFVHIADLEDGKVRRLRIFPDTAALAGILTE